MAACTPNDWPIAAVYHFHGAGEVTRVIFLGDHSRPLAAVYLALVHGISGGSAGRHRPGTARARLLGDPLAAARPGLRPAGGGGACSAAPVVSVRGLDVAVAGRQPVAPLPAPGSAGAARARLRPSVGRRPTRRCPGGAALLVATSVLSYETAVAVLVVAAVAISFRYARGRVALIGALPTVLAVVLAAAVPRLLGLLPGSSPTRASGWGRRSSTPRRSPASR